MNDNGQSLGRRLSFEIVALHNAVGERVGLSAIDHKYLDLIDRDGPLHPSDLARTARLTTGAVTALADRLEQAGFVTRIPDPADRRRVLLQASGPRVAEIGQLMSGIGRNVAPIMANYDTEHAAMITDFVEQLTDAVRRTRLELNTDPDCDRPAQ